MPVPPQNLDAEETVLGAVLLSEHAIGRATETGLDPADFYRASHGAIWRACLSLHRLGQPVDAVTVADRLERSGQLEHAGGATRIHELAALVPAAGNVAYHAHIVQRAARLRRIAVTAAAIASSATSGANPDELELELEQLAQAITDTPAAAADRYHTERLDTFADSFEESAEALAGSNGDTLLPAGGLLILGGEGGAGKTTLTLDALAHLASGAAWMGYQTARPVRVLIIENEGPRAQFREKIREKIATWPGEPFAENIHVHAAPWARFSLANAADRIHLRQTARELRIDLVAADPLDSLGISGGGTPDDVRTFIGWLHECGLHHPEQPLAFWILHHYSKAERGSIVQRLSGAWGGHPDAIIGLDPPASQATTLHWGKLRHATPPKHSSVTLAWNLATRGYSLVDEDARTAARQARLDEITTAILEYVASHPGQSTNAIKTELGETLGVRRADVEEALHQARNDLTLETLAGKRNATLWYPAGSPETTSPANLWGEVESTGSGQSRSNQSAPHPQHLPPRRGGVVRGEVEDEPENSPVEGNPEPAPLAQVSQPPARLETAPPSPFEVARAWLRSEGWMLDRDRLAGELSTRFDVTAGEVVDLLELADRLEQQPA